MFTYKPHADRRFANIRELVSTTCNTFKEKTAFQIRRNSITLKKTAAPATRITRSSRPTRSLRLRLRRFAMAEL